MNLPKKRWFTAILILSICTVFTDAQRPDVDDHFCAVSSSSIAILNDTAYIMGGWWLWSNYDTNIDAEEYNGPNDFYQILPLTTSFNVSSLPLTNLPVAVPRLSSAGLWPTSNTSLTYTSGFQEISSRQRKKKDPMPKKYRASDKWTFTPSTMSWITGMTTLPSSPQKKGSSGGGTPQRQAAGSATAWVPKLGKGYMLNGDTLDDPSTIHEYGTNAQPHKGLLEYEHATETWRNLTSPVDGIGGSGNTLIHVPTATDNLLIAFGGWAYTKEDKRVTDGENDGGVNSLRDIHVFSTAKERWYTLRIPDSEAAPYHRLQHCATLHSAPDNSSHQITIFGGLSREEKNSEMMPGLDLTIWTLSIPSFTWVQLSHSEPQGLSYSPEARIEQACHPLPGGYSLLYGGRTQLNPQSSPNCEKSRNRAFLWDDSSTSYGDTYEPGRQYKVPTQVSAVIGGGPEGGSEKKEPSWGWGDDHLALKEMFVFENNEKEPATTTPEAPEAPEEEEGQVEEEKKSVNVGTVAGGVAAGVVILALGGVGVLLWMRRSRRRRTQGGVYLVELHGQEKKPQELDGTSMPPVELDGWSRQPPAELMHDTGAGTAWSKPVSQ